MDEAVNLCTFAPRALKTPNLIPMGVQRPAFDSTAMSKKLIRDAVRRYEPLVVPVMRCKGRPKAGQNGARDDLCRPCEPHNSQNSQIACQPAYGNSQCCSMINRLIKPIK